MDGERECFSQGESERERETSLLFLFCHFSVALMWQRVSTLPQKIIIVIPPYVIYRSRNANLLHFILFENPILFLFVDRFSMLFIQMLINNKFKYNLENN